MFGIRPGISLTVSKLLLGCTHSPIEMQLLTFVLCKFLGQGAQIA